MIVDVILVIKTFDKNATLAKFHATKRALQ